MKNHRLCRWVTFFHAFFLFPLLPKGRSLPKHGLRGPCCRRAGAGRGGAVARKAPQARPASRGAMPHGAAGCRTLVPPPVEREVPCGAGPAAQAVLLRMDGETLHGRSLAGAVITVRMEDGLARALSARHRLSAGGAASG